MTPRTGAGGAAVLLAALFPAACLQTVVLPPPQARGTGGTGGLGSDGGNLADGPISGDGVGPCPAGTALKIRYDAPTVMIALDHSGSMMSTHFGSSTTATRLTAVQGVIKDLFATFGTKSVNFGYLEFPQVQQNRTCNNGCCVGTVNYPLSGSQVGIRDAMDRCAPPNPSATCLPASDANATPTAQALSWVMDAFNLVKPNVGPQKITLLITDHEPGCGGSADACMQAQMQVATLSSSHIPTYVVAVSAESIPGATDSCLTDLALNSLVPRDSSPRYYWATSDATLRSYLTNPVQTAACYAQVDDSNFDPRRTNVDVAIDGERVPQGTKDGWTFIDLSNGRLGIQFSGTACTKYLKPVADVTPEQKLQVCTTGH
jgi:hypothetical protein